MRYFQSRDRKGAAEETDRTREVTDGSLRSRLCDEWPFEDEAAQHFGRLRRELRRSGRIMPVVDVQLAAIAFAMGKCSVVTKDSDLSAVPGLQVENWATA